MKHVFRYLFAAALLAGCFLQQAFAQQMPPLPVDPNVRIGKLDNGLTYYIRKNDQPANRVEFHIAQKVGSIQEEPQQRGLAHFLEHMCFNGTKNFPGDEKGLGIVPWCETKGIKFGVNLNAYTSVDQTVYRISDVSTENPNVVDSCLLILHDWSNAVLLQEKEIDKERGVIREEWRSRNSGIMRIYTDAQPTLYKGSKYSDCMPIGSIDVINNFPYQVIRDYYAKWYRPDLQGIIIVGDIDVDQMEQKIKSTFADVKKPVNPAERIYYPIDDNEEPLIYIGKDKEIDAPTINLFFKHEATPREAKGNLGYYLQSYLLGMATDMLNARLGELTQSANPPFTSAGVGYQNYFLAKTKDAFVLGINSKADGITDALKAGLKELERMRRFGFTASEYERARANYLQHLESAYNERKSTKNIAYAEEYINHFLDNEPIPGIEYEYTTMNQIVPNIPVEAINQAIQQSNLISDKNQAIMIAAPDKEGIAIPTQEEVAALLKGMKDIQVEAYVDKVSNEPLMKEAPKGGKIVSEKADVLFGATELVLSNGVKVYLKKTDFKADQILMRAYSAGGTSLFDDKDALNFNRAIMNSVVAVGGLSNFSKIDLDKMLAGKKVSLQANVSGTEETLGGSSSPKDFETLMQLTYLQFTAPRKDETAFASFKTRLKAQLENAQANPMASVNDSVTHLLYGNHPRAIYLKSEMVDQIDYDRILALYKERFANAGDFKFFFVGNIDLETVKPLIAQYLGALPAAKAREKVRDNHMDIIKGVRENTYAKEQQTPMATVVMIHSGKCKYTLKNSLLMSFLTQALDMVYTEEIREKEGGTYGVSTYGELSKWPKEECVMQILYQTDPAKKDHLNGLINQLMKKMAAEGPSAEHLQKIKEYMLKKHASNQKENGYWLGALNEYFANGMDKTKDYEALVNGITAQDIQKFAAAILKQGNQATVVMTMPENLK